MSAGRTQQVANLLRRTAGRPLSNAELQSMLAIAAVEGMGAWTGDMAGSQNIGAEQCTVSELRAGGGPTFRCVPHQDRHADGRTYTTGFRYFIDAQGRTAAENGALDFHKVLHAPIRARTGDVLQRGGSLHELADAMHREHYYEGDATGGKDPVLGYAKALEKRVGQVAGEIGQAPAVSLYGGAWGASSPTPWLALLVAGVVAWWLFGGRD